MQNDAANQLHVEVAHIQDAPAGFAANGEGFYQKVVEGCAVRHALFEFDRFRRKILIGKFLQLRFERIDGRDHWLNAFDLSIMFSAKDFGERTFDHKRGQYQFSCWRRRMG